MPRFVELPADYEADVPQIGRDVLIGVGNAVALETICVLFWLAVWYGIWCALP